MLGAANNAAIRSAIGLGQTDAPTFGSLGVTNTATANVFSTSAAALQTAGYLGVARAINLIDTAGISWSSTSTLLGATGTNLLQDAAGILAQRNGTAKQVHRVYNTFLGTTANEWGGFDWLTTTNTLRIGTEHGGTGTARPIDFVTGGVAKWQISAAGHLMSAGVTDNLYDIGASGANRPKALYLAAGITAGGVISGQSYGASTSGYFNWTTRSQITSPSDGVIRLSNDAQNGFTRLELGAANLGISRGTGSPEGVVTALVGSLYLRTDGGLLTTLYVKESSPTPSTGWVGK